jgi:hypothetical protein
MPKKAATADPVFALDPSGIATFAAEVIAKELKSRVVPNHSYETPEAASAAGFSRLWITFLVPASVTSRRDLMPYLSKAAQELSDEIKAYGGDAFLVFAPPCLRTMRLTSGTTETFGSVTIGCTVWEDVGHQYGVTISALILANRK